MHSDKNDTYIKKTILYVFCLCLFVTANLWNCRTDFVKFGWQKADVIRCNLDYFYSGKQIALCETKIKPIGNNRYHSYIKVKKKQN